MCLLDFWRKLYLRSENVRSQSEKTKKKKNNKNEITTIINKIAASSGDLTSFVRGDVVFREILLCAARRHVSEIIPRVIRDHRRRRRRSFRRRVPPLRAYGSSGQIFWMREWVAGRRKAHTRMRIGSVECVSTPPPPPPTTEIHEYYTRLHRSRKTRTQIQKTANAAQKATIVTRIN